MRLLGALLRLTSYDTATELGRSQERYRRAALTSSASLVARGITTAATLVSVPLALNYLGAERYGLWVTVGSLVTVLAFADFGIGNGLLNAIAEAHGKDDEQLARSYVSSAFFLLTGVAAVLGLLLVLLYPHIPWAQAFNVRSPQAAAEVGPTVLVFLGCTLLNVPLGIAIRVQMGYQEGFLNSAWEAAGSLLGLGGLVVVVNAGADLPWLVLAMVGAPVLATAGNGVSLGLRRWWLWPRWSAIDTAACTRILKSGLLFAALQLIAAAAFLSDNLIVARLFGPDAVAGYSIHARLLGLAPVVAALALSPLWPAYGEAVAKGDIAWVRKTLIRSVLASVVFVGGASFLVMATGEGLLRLWVGPTVRPSAPLMVGFAVWAVLSTMGNAVAMFLNGANVLRVQLLLACVMGLAAVVAKVVLGQLWGLPGIVWGTVLAYALFTAAPLGVLLPRILVGLAARPGEARR